MEDIYMAEIAFVWSMMLHQKITATQVKALLRTAAGLKMLREEESSAGIEEPEQEPDPEEEQAEIVPEENDEKPSEKKRPGRKKTLDYGKIGALHRAGWPAAKIADEMGCNVTTIHKWIQKQREEAMLD